jgi:hypothetical protein
MAYPSVTYTFTNGTTASATEVNQNFTDLINGLSDGTKDLSISALTVAGTASLNGAVNIGNATSDDIAVNGYITTALIPKADDSYDLGTAALAWQDGYFDGAVYTDTISELTAANGVTIDETKLKDGGVILKTGSEISDAGGKYVKIKGGDGSGAVAAGYVGYLFEDTETTGVSVTSETVVCTFDVTVGVWAIYGQVEILTNNPTSQNANPRVLLQAGDSESVGVNSLRLEHPVNSERNGTSLMRYFVTGATTTIYLKVIPNLASGSYTAKGKLTAIRIA